MSDNYTNNLDSLRDQVIDQLTSHYAAAQLTMEEFEQRVSVASLAQNRSALTMLLADLPEQNPKAYPANYQNVNTNPSNGNYRLNLGAVRPTDEIVCIFSAQERKGNWKPPARLNLLNVFGATSLDFSKAELPPGELKIGGLAVFGAIEIIVPRGVRVQAKGFGVFGAVENKTDEPDQADAPTITIDCSAIFGAVEIRHPKK